MGGSVSRFWDNGGEITQGQVREQKRGRRDSQRERIDGLRQKIEMLEENEMEAISLLKRSAERQEKLTRALLREGEREDKMMGMWEECRASCKTLLEREAELYRILSDNAVRETEMLRVIQEQKVREPPKPPIRRRVGQQEASPGYVRMGVMPERE